MKSFFVMMLAAAGVSMSVSAALHEFDHTSKIKLRTEPAGFESHVVMSQETDRVVFDCRKAFAKGMKNLVCELDSFEDASFAGDDVLFEVFAGCEGVNGSVNVYLQMWRELDGNRRFHVLKSRTPFVTDSSAGAVTRCVVSDACPLKSGGYRLRFDFRRPVRGGVYFFKRGRVALMSEMTVSVQPKKVKPEVTMYLPFDGSSKAAFAKGSAVPLAEKGVSYGKGLKGKAVYVAAANRTTLEYAFKDNLSQQRGAISMWIRRDRVSKDSGIPGCGTFLPLTIAS